MKNIVNIKDIRELSTKLSTENKKYVIAVANALLFSQAQTARSGTFKQSGKKPKRETCQSLLIQRQLDGYKNKQEKIN